MFLGNVTLWKLQQVVFDVLLLVIINKINVSIRLVTINKINVLLFGNHQQMFFLFGDHQHVPSGW